jgi:hypothetical protein
MELDILMSVGQHPNCKNPSLGRDLPVLLVPFSLVLFLRTCAWICMSSHDEDVCIAYFVSKIMQ